MIELTRLNRRPFVVNSDLIKFIEKAPDTVLSLTNGEKIVVLETPQEVVERVITFRRSVLTGALSLQVDPNAALAGSAQHTCIAGSSPNVGENSVG